jgi:hypothetical protein
MLLRDEIPLKWPIRVEIKLLARNFAPITYLRINHLILLDFFYHSPMIELTNCIYNPIIRNIREASIATKLSFFFLI